jgi:thermostable 8-oxoguanine DNA glycosylase
LLNDLFWDFGVIVLVNQNIKKEVSFCATTSQTIIKNTFEFLKRITKNRILVKRGYSPMYYNPLKTQREC